MGFTSPSWSSPLFKGFRGPSPSVASPTSPTRCRCSCASPGPKSSEQCWSGDHPPCAFLAEEDPKICSSTLRTNRKHGKCLKTMIILIPLVKIPRNKEKTEKTKPSSHGWSVSFWPIRKGALVTCRCPPCSASGAKQNLQFKTLNLWVFFTPTHVPSYPNCWAPIFMENLVSPSRRMSPPLSPLGRWAFGASAHVRQRSFGKVGTSKPGRGWADWANDRKQ